MSCFFNREKIKISQIFMKTLSSLREAAADK